MADDATTPTLDDATAADEKPAQTVTVEDAGPARKKLTIEVPEERIQEKLASLQTRLQDDAVIPGFRRGRAPQRLIEKRFGEDIRKDAKGQLLSESYSQAIEEHDFDVLGEPDVKDLDDIELPESGPLKYEVEIEVTPEIELPEFGDLHVEKPVREITDEDVDKEVEQFRERMGRMVPVEDPEATIRVGDYVQVDAHLFEGQGHDPSTLDAHAAPEATGEGGPEAVQHQHDAYILVHGEEHDHRGHVMGILVQDMGQRLVGKKPGETEVIEMTGPSGHEDERVKDQPVTLVIALKRIERLDPLPMDQVLERLGVETEDEAKARVKEMLEQRAEREAQSAMHDQVVEKLLEKVELELPEGLTGRQAERSLQRRRMELLYHGTPEQEIDERMAELRGESQEDAKRELKRFFILDRVAKDYDIEVEESELNQRIAMQAMQQGRRPERVRQEMQQRGDLQHLYMQIREQKTIDRILQDAAVQEVEAKDDGDAEQAPA